MKPEIRLLFFKKMNWLLSLCLILLGFYGATSCESKEEYGTPYSNFTIKGKVLSESDQPIPEIKINITPEEMDHNISDAFTNSKGEFEVTFTGYFPSYQLISKDIDGAKNGSFINDTIRLSFSKDDYYNKGKGWYQGDAKKEVTIVLKEQETTPH